MALVSEDSVFSRLVFVFFVLLSCFEGSKKKLKGFFQVVMGLFLGGDVFCWWVPVNGVEEDGEEVEKVVGV